MATFKVGQRVRVNCPGTQGHGLEGTIYNIVVERPNWAPSATRKGAGGTAYLLHLDGFGKFWPGGGLIGYPAHMLQPLTDPGVQALKKAIEKFDGFKKKLLQPLAPELLEEPDAVRITK